MFFRVVSTSQVEDCQTFSLRPKNCLNTRVFSQHRWLTKSHPSQIHRGLLAIYGQFSLQSDSLKLNLTAEEVGQAGRKASWVPVPNCARDFIDSMAVVEWTSLTNMEAIEWQQCQASILSENSALLLRSSLWFVFYHTKLYGSWCHFSFVNQCTRRNCTILNISQPLHSNWSWIGVNCIINVKTRSLLKVGVLQCTTVVSWRISALLF